MTPADWERAAAIYLPLVATVIAGLLTRGTPRQFAACLLSLLWSTPSLLVLQILNLHTHWWSFAPGSAASLRDMLLELFVGWILLWGLLPQLAFPRLDILPSALIMLAIDLVLMPVARAAVHLNRNWQTAMIQIPSRPPHSRGK